MLAGIVGGLTVEATVARMAPSGTPRMVGLPTVALLGAPAVTALQGGMPWLTAPRVGTDRMDHVVDFSPDSIIEFIAAPIEPITGAMEAQAATARPVATVRREGTARRVE